MLEVLLGGEVKTEATGEPKAFARGDQGGSVMI